MVMSGKSAVEDYGPSTCTGVLVEQNPTLILSTLVCWICTGEISLGMKCYRRLQGHLSPCIMRDTSMYLIQLESCTANYCDKNLRVIVIL